MSNSKTPQRFTSLRVQDAQVVLNSVVKHLKKAFTEEEIEAALFISDPIVVTVDGGLIVLADSAFFMQLAIAVKTKTHLETSKSIDFLEEEIFGGGKDIMIEGAEFVYVATHNKLIRHFEGSFLEN